MTGHLSCVFIGFIVEVIEKYVAKIAALEDDVNEIMADEVAEKQIAKTENQLNKVHTEADLGLRAEGASGVVGFVSSKLLVLLSNKPP